MSREPKPARPYLPGYGLEEAKRPPGQAFPWPAVRSVLERARLYWIGSTRPDGRPHAAPVWGVWLEDACYFSTGDRSRKAKNLARNPNAVVLVQGEGDEAVIVEGAVKRTDDPTVLAPVWAAYKEKYDWDMDGEAFYVVRPRAVLSFREDLGDTATRWEFG